MIPASFDYVAPTSVEDALAALAEAGDDGKVLAGGQSLLPVLRLRMAAPGLLVDLRKIDELHGVRLDGDSVVIGAMTTHHDVVVDPIVGQHVSLLVKTEGTVADPAVRHRGTLGGALVHADPAGDLGAVALALEATFHIAGSGGRREVAAVDFFQDYFATAVGEDEILVAVSFPSYAGWGAHYEKFTRVAQSWSIVSVAAAIKITGGAGSGGVVEAARVGLTNMGPVPIRAHTVEQALIGGPATAEAVKAAAESATDGTSPVDDTSAAADYRQHLARVLTARAVLAAVG